MNLQKLTKSTKMKLDSFIHVFHRTFRTRFARNEIISDTTKLLKRSLIILWFSRMLVSASGIANRRSTGSESSLVCCPIAKELTFAGFSVYFAQFYKNFSYFSLVLSFFGITSSTNRCELPPLNATVCHLPQTWKNILIFKNRFQICQFFPFRQWRRCMYFWDEFGFAWYDNFLTM